MRVVCWINKATHKHILRICNTYQFSTATVVARTHLNVPLSRALLLLFNFISENKKRTPGCRMALYIVYEKSYIGDSISPAEFIMGKLSFSTPCAFTDCIRHADWDITVHICHYMCICSKDDLT
jgi:hypothetical protein